jgi:predicted nicotinamide N-methyase
MASQDYWHVRFRREFFSESKQQIPLRHFYENDTEQIVSHKIGKVTMSAEHLSDHFDDSIALETEEEETSIFAALMATEFSVFDDDNDTFKTPRYIRRPRDWKIPTFEQQCNGINSFVLRPDVIDKSDSSATSEGVVIQLEHRKHSTGSDLWDAALVLAHALSRSGIILRNETVEENSQVAFIPNVLQGLRVLELGSGTGALGLYSAKCLKARHVILTDLCDNLDLLDRNRKANDLCDQASLLALDWKENQLPQNEMLDAGEIDLILGSDLFLPFASFLLDPLARTIRDLLVLSRQRRTRSDEAGANEMKARSSVATFAQRLPPQALICYEERFDVTPFFEAALRYGLKVQLVDPLLLHPMYQDPDYIKLLRITLV